MNGGPGQLYRVVAPTFVAGFFVNGLGDVAAKADILKRFSERADHDAGALINLLRQSGFKVSRIPLHSEA